MGCGKKLRSQTNVCVWGGGAMGAHRLHAHAPGSDFKGKRYYLKGKIAKIIPGLLSSAQFRPSTIKKTNLVPELYKWVCFRPYGELAHHGGLPCQRQVN